MVQTILIVDDEKNIRTSLTRILELEGYRCEPAASLDDARQILNRFTPDLALLDVGLPDGSGLDLLLEIKNDYPDMPVLVMSGHGTIETALEAVKRGAHDFMEKPLSADRILITLSNALTFEGQRRELATLREQVESRHNLIGSSGVMLSMKEMILLAAPSKSRVLITGESGTGKELIARAIHRESKRQSGPFIKINCAAIPGELIESELFGHEKGSFTGASQMRKGKFELAHGGTLFLDEIGDMRMDVQAKLLRALQEGEIERVGGSKPLQVDVRVVAATNKDLEAAIEAGDFREDLFYRLNVLPIQAPPLRDRKEDLPELVKAFVAQICEENDLRPKEVSADALEVLAQHDWPGNVRELRNACERLVILTPQPTIDGPRVRRVLGQFRTVPGQFYRAGVPLKELMAEAERSIIIQALNACDNHVTQTAASLAIERSHLYKKMRALEIERD